METTVDSVGRIVVPKALRDALGLRPGSTVDISRYGAGLQLVPTGRTAQLVEEDGALVATGQTPIDDDTVFGLIDSGRRCEPGRGRHERRHPPSDQDAQLPRRGGPLVGRARSRLCGHALAETYSVLTRLPGDLRLTPRTPLASLRPGSAHP